MVMIVDDPDIGLVRENIVVKRTGERCRHLRGDKPGEFSCAVHDRKWYKKSPCFSHGQIERSPDDVCRTGEWMLKKIKEGDTTVLDFYLDKKEK